MYCYSKVSGRLIECLIVVLRPTYTEMPLLPAANFANGHCPTYGGTGHPFIMVISEDP